MLYFPYIGFFSCNEGVYCNQHQVTSNITMVYTFDSNNYISAILENLQLQQQQPTFEVVQSYQSPDGSSPSTSYLTSKLSTQNLHYQIPFLYGYFKRIDSINEQRWDLILDNFYVETWIEFYPSQAKLEICIGISRKWRDILCTSVCHLYPLPQF